ncbi:cell division protein ZapA [Fervidobacterium thailandense]|uniref:Cell division protein ZapA n=1 Tax=Fervidobacterium thailandense TaxID=1008305 RepID=A0A1E3G3V3_9BACT|nr:cell division protein ZapA [Fervidobacterium thailandense]ODN30840.1 cell division protein ZapA [Fervidobacterium thailandense]
MKKVKISIFGQEYELASDSPDEAINHVYRRLKELQSSYKTLYNEVSFDELLVLMLCDVLEREYYFEKKLVEILEKTRIKIKTLEGEGTK